MTDLIPSDEVRAAAENPANVFGKYVRLRERGRGGFGSVWLAWDLELSRRVALKILRAPSAQDVARFKREARTAAGLSHPNIVAVHDVGEAHGEHYIAMEYVDGVPADEVPLRPREAAEIIRQVAAALQHAHEHGVIHRDVKPQNILIVGDGPAKAMVGDFGLAKSLAGEPSLSMTGDIMGTPSFMAPEQARGRLREVGPATDVWGMGATLYALCAGRAPFEGREPDAYALLQRVIEDDPPRPRALNAALDADLETIILKCLEKESARRYPTAAELGRDLERWLAGEPIAAHPPSIAYRWRKRLAKRRAVATMALALAATLAILGSMWWKAREGQRQAQRAVELWQKIGIIERDGELYGRAGDVVRMRARLEEAIRICRDSVRTHDWPHGQYFLGRLLRAAGRREEARRALDRALELNPNLGEARYERGLLLVEEYGDRLRGLQERMIARGDGERPIDFPTTPQLEATFPELEPLRAQAVADLSAQVGESSYFKKVDGLFGKAELARIQGRLAESRAQLEQILELEPLYAPAWVSLAWVAAAQGRPDEAIERAGGAIERYRGWAPAYRARAAGHALKADAASDPAERGRERRAALEDMGRAIEMGDESADAYAARGDAALKSAFVQGVTGEDARATIASAIEDYGRAMGGRLPPTTNRGVAHAALAEQQDLHGEDPRASLRRAIDDFSESLRRNRFDAMAYLGLGNAHLALGEGAPKWGEDPDPHLGRAVEQFERMSRLFPLDGGALTNLGIVHIRRGEARAGRGENPAPEFERALEAFGRAIAANAKLSQAYRNRGVVHFMMNNYTAALRDWRKTIELNPTDEPTLRPWIRQCEAAGADFP
jgi:serine/threonine-protein kinase